MKIPAVKIFERYFRGLAKEKSEPIEVAEPTNVVESIEAPERDPYEILFSQWAGETGLVKGFPQYNDNMITSWKLGTPYGEIINSAMLEAEYLFAHDLLRELQGSNTPGAIVEFGVYEGDWLKHLSDSLKTLNFDRPIYGFDSFEGLPAPIQEIDLIGFAEGDLHADFDRVYKFLECDKRDITLVKGWFCDSLKLEPAQSIREICFARIDCDLFAGAMDALSYLKDRLVDGAILVFDDWSHIMNVGESRAFFEWAPTSGLTFEFLALNGWVHLYLRVRRGE